MSNWAESIIGASSHQDFLGSRCLRDESSKIEALTTVQSLHFYLRCDCEDLVSRMDYVSYIFFGVFCGYTSYIGFANFILHRHCLTYTASLLIYSHVPSSPLSRFARCTDVVQLYFDVSICHSDTSPIDPKDGFKWQVILRFPFLPCAG
ncbi:uncharacterized protein LAJ45_09025 [Morchella importuna]|uniref:uncharacterized protein n=1 Tax=Morchella importuna TaxID=1174673 RepID=UPI001E8D93F7|nr:uncharacterized protein LAJ45_09025 [Morchella importuna]KAH8146945.1 hypothetical protein LAJ45_09025 [Morchella importuna]